MGQVKHIGEKEFDQTVASGVTLVDFYAEWCGPCRMLSPVIEQLAGEMTEVAFAKIDVDTAQKLAVNFQITSVPTIVLFKDGKEVNRLLGLRDKAKLKEFIATAK